MTVAICIKCGATKHGALTPCRKCGFDPKENEDKAKAMVLTDHFLSEPDLEQIGQRIQTGQPVQYPEETVKDYIKLFEENPSMNKMPIRFAVGCFVVVLLLAVAIGFVKL